MTRFWLRDAIRHELWPLPLLSVVVGIGIGVALPWLDGNLDGPTHIWKAVLVGGGADAARSLLTTIAASIMTVTSLTFSLTVVTLQLASSQYTPRMLRTFSSDRVVHWTLAVFLGTFTYSLVVLRTVRSPASGSEFVPHISVTFAFLLGLGSVAALVLFLGHLTREIRAENILDQLRKAGIAGIERHYPPIGGGTGRQVPEHPPVLLRSHGSGFLTSVDLGRVADLGAALHRIVHLSVHPGNYVLSGAILAVAAGPPLTEDETKNATEKLNSSITLGPERTQLMDTAFPLSQLADVAARALSPGTNDPTTAVNAIHHVAAVLVHALAHDCSPLIRIDPDTKTGATVPLPGFSELLHQALTPIRTYGSQDPRVAGALAGTIGSLACNDHAQRHRATFLAFLGELEDSVEKASMTVHDRSSTQHGIEDARQHCAGF